MMMKRVLCLSAASAVCGASRSVHSVTVANNVTAATTAAKLGSAISSSEVAAAHKLPASMLEKAVNPRVRSFTQMELSRARFAPLVATINATDDFRTIELAVEQSFAKDASKLKPVPGALKKFTDTPWKNMMELMRFYEETMYPIRAKHREYTALELTNFHIKDVLKRGLTAFKQDYLDEQKAELVKIHAGMKACTDFLNAAVQDAFSTSVCNDLVNILRIGGDKHEHAHRMALKVLEDMNLMKVAFDDTTRTLVSATVFHDGPFDSSPLLFQVIEYPERGEIHLGEGSLNEVSEQMLKLISIRHQTPLDDGVLLRSPDTYPNLQRSPE